MASGPITSWQIDGETVEIVADFVFLGSKITADGASSHEIKRRLLLGRKAMTNLDSILESKEELKSFLMKMKEETEKAGLKLNFQKIKVRASSPITSWQIDGETMETVRDFIFLGSKITADSDFSHEIERRLLLGIKAMTNLDSILKSKDVTLPTKVHLVKALVFLVVMNGCESWL